MAKIGLMRPAGSKSRQYQGLEPLSAIEPPHWMLVRANTLMGKGHTVTLLDEALEGDHPHPADLFHGCSHVEIWPGGVHPSAFVQERANIESAIADLDGMDTRVIDTTMPKFDIATSPAWHGAPLSGYRPHNWQVWGESDNGVGYGTIHTSISCPFNCDFCAIHGYYPAPYSRRAARDVERDIGTLYDKGVRTFKIMDELFIVGDMTETCSILANFPGINVWGYARVDSIVPESEEMLSRAGIRWICLGYESGNQDIRKSMHKGSFDNQHAYHLARRLRGADIKVLGNFMFGFPDDNADTMAETLEFALKLVPEYANFYCMVAYPGTKVEEHALTMGWDLPSHPDQYAQYAYDFLPLRTHYLTAAEVLKFRDYAWDNYHASNWYRTRIEHTLGSRAASDVTMMVVKKLRRKLLEKGN